MNSVLVAIPSMREISLLHSQFAIPDGLAPHIIECEGFDMAVCGVGMLDFAVNLSAILANSKYACVLQVGICGAYPGRGLAVGDVVRVRSEVVGDMGVQEADGAFTHWSEMVEGAARYAENGCDENAGILPEPLRGMRSVAGLTVNRCTGTASLSLDRQARFGVDVESMEGAALFAVCRRFGIPGFEFRAVSNIATDRNPSTWRIPEAMAALKREVLDKL
jgi:futalosine hydrolase